MTTVRPARVRRSNGVRPPALLLGKAHTVRVIGYRQQRTLACPATVAGVGLFTGVPVTARFLPAAPDTGLLFRRTDRPGAPDLPARAERVTGTQRRTTLGHTGAGVSLVEHVLAALAGLRIDNCIIELDAPEPPGLDG
ncbi:MAG: UDP-3-O-acyl-N-acetylglucosamine deacetylase, partial [Planctomycetes bacterium]|nr:UDP-3-O-acyl-N-acetylglucosamine deacetylase [Planctomycetota bacterium]